MPYTFNPFTGGLDGAGAGGLADAPSDGVLRARKNGSWSTIDAADIPSLPANGLDMTLIEATDGLYGYIGDIGVNQFVGDTSLTGLYLGNSVTSIGNQAFYECSGLIGSLTIPNSVTSIGSLAFQSCSGFTGSLTIPNSVTSIGSSAFYNCSGFTGSLTIPNSVTSIGSLAFYDCSGFTGSLTIGTSVSSINDGAFESCNGFTGSLTIPGTASIGSFAFYACSFNGLNVTGTSINSNAFEYNKTNAFGSLNIANTITSIGNQAFYECSGLIGSLTIPNSITSIGSYAFDSCSGFTGSLTIPNSITSIGGSAFRNCFNLTNAYLNQPLSAIGSNAFQNSGLTTIHLQPSPNTPAGWTIGSGQTIRGKSGITVVANWTTHPNPP